MENGSKMEVRKETRIQAPSKTWVAMAQKAINDFEAGRITTARFRSKLTTPIIKKGV